MDIAATPIDMHSDPALGAIQHALADYKSADRFVSPVLDQKGTPEIIIGRPYVTLRITPCRLDTPGTPLCLELKNIDTDVQVQKQGHGQRAMLDLFTLADRLDAARVVLLAAKTGRYAHAANHMRCEPSEWPHLQSQLLAAAAAYKSARNLSPRHRRTRQLQAARAVDVIQDSNGELGQIVTALRLPIAGGCERHSTLAKLLFLGQHAPHLYNGYWLPQDWQRLYAHDAAATRPQPGAAAANPRLIMA